MDKEILYIYHPESKNSLRILEILIQKKIKNIKLLSANNLDKNLEKIIKTIPVLLDGDKIIKKEEDILSYINGLTI